MDLRTSLAVALGALALAASGCTNAASTTDAADAGTQNKTPAAEKDAEAAAQLPADVAKSGVLTFASDASYAPFEYFDTDNKTIVGLDIELTDALAETLGVEARHVNAGFDTILPGLGAGKYDAGASAFSVTEERRAAVDFVPYLEMGSGLAVASGNPHELTLDDTSTLCGRTVTAQKGSIQGIETLPRLSDECEKSGKAPIKVQLYPSQNQANLALASGRSDAVMADSGPLAYEGQQSGGAFELAEGSDYDPVPLGLALPNGSELGKPLSAAMAVLVENGTLEALFEKWDVPLSGMPTSTDLVE
jgi:polar amino acid transport system substrate-binding protein